LRPFAGRSSALPLIVLDAASKAADQIAPPVKWWSPELSIVSFAGTT